jgi:hypothetical protein
MHILCVLFGSNTRLKGCDTAKLLCQWAWPWSRWALMGFPVSMSARFCGEPLVAVHFLGERTWESTLLDMITICMLLRSLLAKELPLAPELLGQGAWDFLPFSMDFRMPFRGSR